MNAVLTLALALWLGAMLPANAEPGKGPQYAYRTVHFREPSNDEVQRVLDALPESVAPMEKVSNGSTRISGRIIGGSLAGHNQFPYQVGLLTNLGSFGGGSVIGSRWVLTAAHVVPDQGFEWIQVHACGNRWRDAAVKAYVSVAYIPSPHDIAVFKLAQDLPLSDCVRTIGLETQGCRNNAVDNVNGLVSGWGSRGQVSPYVQDDLWYVNTQIISNDECRRTFQINDEHICTKALNNGNGVCCGGDSGGPLVLSQTGRQVGVVNFVAANHPVCENGAPTGYTRVPCFIDFIRDVMNNN